MPVLQRHKEMKIPVPVYRASSGRDLNLGLFGSRWPPLPDEEPAIHGGAFRSSRQGIALRIPTVLPQAWPSPFGSPDTNPSDLAQFFSSGASITPSPGLLPPKPSMHSGLKFIQLSAPSLSKTSTHTFCVLRISLQVPTGKQKGQK